MTSATDELRRMLDERGVEWVGTNFTEPTKGHPTNTSLGSEHHYAVFIEYTDGSVLRQFDLTSEQAIAATLGSGELVRCKDCASFIRDATPHDDDRPHFCTELGVDLADGDGFCAWACARRWTHEHDKRPD